MESKLRILTPCQPYQWPPGKLSDILPRRRTTPTISCQKMTMIYDNVAKVSNISMFFQLNKFIASLLDHPSIFLVFLCSHIIFQLNKFIASLFNHPSIFLVFLCSHIIFQLNKFIASLLNYPSIFLVFLCSHIIFQLRFIASHIIFQLRFIASLFRHINLNIKHCFVGCVLLVINPCRLFNTKFCLYIYIKHTGFVNV